MSYLRRSPRIYTPLTNEIFARLVARSRLEPDTAYFAEEPDTGSVTLYYAISPSDFRVIASSEPDPDPVLTQETV